ncbi:hypothetical protein Trydic_g11272 [Trypoxylus dichotomus]
MRSKVRAITVGVEIVGRITVEMATSELLTVKTPTSRIVIKLGIIHYVANHEKKVRSNTYSRTGRAASTKILIRNLRPWVNRKHGQVSYFLRQFLRGHGSYQAYLRRFGISETDECNYCNGIDAVEHTFFECPTWAPERQQAERIIGHVTPTTIVASMLENEGNWKAEESMVRKIMGKKESHERSRHRANMQNELRME